MPRDPKFYHEAINFYQVMPPNIPTFYLPVDLQGIVSQDHAARIASDVTNRIVDPVSCTLVTMYGDAQELPAESVDIR
jgi:hypothetical protein